MSKEPTLEDFDPLTGLYSRKYAFNVFERLLDSARQTDIPVGIIFADIDRMFSYNKAYGMSHGDEIIRLIAEALRAAIGGDGLTCRCGGDEFLALLPGFSAGAAGRKAEEALVAARQVTHPDVIEQDEPNYRSLTLGVAAFPDNGSDPEAVIRAADKALLRAKKSGSGGVAVA